MIGPPSADDMRNVSLDALALVLACLRGDREAADLMLASYADPAEREQLFAALTANSACLARLAGSQAGVDPERLLAAVAASVRERAGGS